MPDPCLLCGPAHFCLCNSLMPSFPYLIDEKRRKVGRKGAFPKPQGGYWVLDMGPWLKLYPRAWPKKMCSQRKWPFSSLTVKGRGRVDGQDSVDLSIAQFFCLEHRVVLPDCPGLCSVQSPRTHPPSSELCKITYQQFFKIFIYCSWL